MNRPRVVLDTNVIISAILFGGIPRHVLEMIIAGKIECTLSPAILEELTAVLQRPKFGFPQEACLQLVEELRGICDIVTPARTINAIKADITDNRIIECAVEARAGYILSGDAHLLKLGRFKNISILTTAEFLKEYETN